MQLKRSFVTVVVLLSFLHPSFAQEPTLLDHGGGVRTVVFSPVNASLVASAGESNIIKLWNLQTNAVKTLRGHTGIVNSIAFSPNGELLASVSDDRTIKLWNVRNQQNIATLREGTLFRTVAFSPDGKLLATAGWMHVKLWDVGRRAEIATLQHDKSVQTVAFSYDGQLLAAGDASGGRGTVKVWDVQKRQVIVTLEDNLVFVRAVTFSPDDQYLASSHYNGEIKLWNVSDWELLHTIPQAGDYDVAFSPNGKMITGTGNGYVSVLWAENGARAARLPGPTGYIHPIDFSPDSAALAVGAEDGIVRIWRINAFLADGNDGGVRILHIDTYLQQLPRANSANRENIPEPAPPPAIVRDFFELDPFYEQWINVGGLPVIASAKVNPYALKEAAWLIGKMIEHRPNVLRAMVGNKARFSVIAHTEIITEIPEYRSDPRPDFLVFRERGWGGTEGGTISTSEEDILNYPGSFAIRYEALIHELAHGIHLLGLNTLDPTFDNRLRITYERAMRKGLWQGTYASSDRREYWAEATHAWFYPNGASSFDRFGNTRQGLKEYDPELATLLAEVYGNHQWQYTPIGTRNRQPHLQGFNPQNSPTFDGWPELAVLFQQLRDPKSDDSGEWVNLKAYTPNQLSRLNESSTLADSTTIIFVNFTQADVLVYEVAPDGMERYWTRVPPTYVRGIPSKINRVWLVKDPNGRNIAVFQAQEKIGRAGIGAMPDHMKRTESGDVNGGNPQVLIAEPQCPQMYWIDAKNGTLHRLVGTEVENLLPSVQKATGLVLNSADNKIYWTEQVGKNRGRVKCANLDGSNVQVLANIKSGVPRSIAVDTTQGKLYWTNSRGRIQRANLNGKGIRNIIQNLKSPENITVDLAGGKLYWTEDPGRIRRANLNGKEVEDIASGLSPVSDIAISGNKLCWTEITGRNRGKIVRANLNGSNARTLATPLNDVLDIAVDAVGKKLYWSDSAGKIRRSNLVGRYIKNVVSGLAPLADFALGSSGEAIATAPSISASLPDSTQLQPNFPNPFNPETWIPYQLAESADVSISIYTADGQLVRTLDLGHQPVGIYESRSRAAYWDGRNALGESVASGVYFYTLTAGEFTATRKMLILK